MERSGHEKYEYLVCIVIYLYVAMVGTAENEVKTPKLKISQVYQQKQNCDVLLTSIK